VKKAFGRDELHEVGGPAKRLCWKAKPIENPFFDNNASRIKQVALNRIGGGRIGTLID
jgi:hypothetical protein